MHEEIESIRTKLHASQVNEKIVLNDLYQVRDRMLKIAAEYDTQKAAEIEKMVKKPKTYNGPALDFQDSAKAAKIRARENKAKQQLEWNGESDIELICTLFTNFLTTPTAKTQLEIEANKTPPVEKNVSPNQPRLTRKGLSILKEEKDGEDDGGLDEDEKTVEEAEGDKK